LPLAASTTELGIWHDHRLSAEIRVTRPPAPDGELDDRSI
jgi:hypothetical protein